MRSLLAVAAAWAAVYAVLRALTRRATRTPTRLDQTLTDHLRAEAERHPLSRIHDVFPEDPR